ncbi:3-oxoacyl-[acyl-carrier-protein] synthase 1 [compost metagenome]
MTGHCLSAAGSIESVASVLQLKYGFIFPSINCKDLHPQIAEIVNKNNIKNQIINQNINILAKASFGFGDVNACLILKKY